MNAAQTRQKNQAEFWNGRQAAATTPEARAAVWYDACRMRAREADKKGDPPLWDLLASHLHDFFQAHGR
ncbi:hypothetical protein PV382_18165 [Streptomyces scabiei]|uniref:hypothetical protein n=1 Tax=Streptomyces scabiei TaxID=1930 RepID=UPI0029BF70D4|nr:hypothetical protein [Streptomyces scabiei]MDX2658252.1 hypothetical protein [Streptomyces scabiei]MDX2870537.1 hypothetical protein [Streptomyces scabiei]MDX2999483.1 hypothetical protein [Streptomyces scabiei]MDX3053043.1 hypothetical protein [Streptomyces scabiei]MDX3174203.1 hypothetical protein [Streptomyces scabiei]